MTAFTRASKAGTRTPNPAKKPGPSARRPSKRQSSPTGESRKGKQQKLIPFLTSHQAVDDRRQGQAEITAPEPSDEVADDIAHGPIPASKNSSTTTEAADYSGASTQELNECYDHQLLNQSTESRDSGYGSFQSSGLFSRLCRTINGATLRIPAAAHDYTFAYELQSITQSWSRNSRDSSITATSIWKDVINMCKSDPPTVVARQNAYRALAEGRAYEAFTSTSWDPCIELPPERLDHKSLYQEATLSWSQTTNINFSPFELSLHAPRTQQSCRFHRMFGGDRFLTLNIPDYKAGKVPGTSNQEYCKAVAEWIYNGIEIAHRHWFPFWVEDKPQQDKHDNWGHQIYLFATTGVGLEGHEISLKEFLNIHAQFEFNMQSANHKLFGRCKLGLSKTVPTLSFNHTNFYKWMTYALPPAKS